MAAPAGGPDKHNPVAGILWMVAAALCFSASLTLVKALQVGGMTVFQAVLFRQVFGLMLFTPIILQAGVKTLKTTVPFGHCAAWWPSFPQMLQAWMEEPRGRRSLWWRSMLSLTPSSC